MLHDLYLTLRPMQYRPPLAGAGLLQSRNDLFIPPPQEREHSPYLNRCVKHYLLIGFLTCLRKKLS